jgi:hypothetical protein
MNRLRKIDLNPLSHCQKLSVLDISINQLNEIDLAPLEQCIELEELFLFSNHKLERNNFERIDISPLFACSNLEDLSFSKSAILIANSKLRGQEDIPIGLEDLIAENRITWE